MPDPLAPSAGHPAADTASARDSKAPSTPTEITAALNADVAAALPLDDTTDRENADRGLLVRPERVLITDDRDRTVWDSAQYDFLEGSAPDSANPSLWRHAQLDNTPGLYEVCDGLYQVRGFDLATMTVVRGDTGWIVIDPLTVIESARAAFALVTEVLGARPVTGMIYTHSHRDHYGGAAGVLPPEDAAARDVPVIAPAGFIEEIVSETVIAGPAMARRRSFHFGTGLEKSPRGHINNGIGMSTGVGSFVLVPPTMDITHTGQEVVVDGVRIVFQMTPDAEAPAEMMFWFPEFKALCVAENCNSTMHNLYTLRGAQVRDALAWSDYIQEALHLFGDEAEVCFGSHNWPTFGGPAVRTFLANQRDLYRYLHDQTMRLANHGYTSTEIAEELQLPSGLAGDFSCRGYYGTVSHNAKAVYQRYLGWFDGNPAALDPLPPEESAHRAVRYMSGVDAVVARARDDFASGDYRWVAEVVSRAVFAEPEHAEARQLLADTFDQLGYQAESALWRNFYLTGAAEIRAGTPHETTQTVRSQVGMLHALPTPELLNWVGVRVNGRRAEGKDLRFELTFPERDECWSMGICNSTIHYWPEPDPDAQLRLSLPRALFEEILVGLTPVEGVTTEPAVDLSGDPATLAALVALLDTFTADFAIAEP
ncbi:alkyl/aryl-sulfatase [Dietzia natronolimnaea]|uniref:alkyl/aryl-sulfatase n=1 Tax=Dietzia natronolimnaea TaxID=161920 RepID=UPI0015F995A0|nr:alkyl sulfatase dimerization domain-containing protein [Dietzia natronolimnaea]MBB1037666.1 MBL fold metallo-hydrolase [Dietzia natronolimnaea]